MDLGAEPFDHALVVLLPALLKQRLLGEAFLRIDHDDLGAVLARLLQRMSHHRDALVGTRRAAVGIGRSDHHNDAAVGHRIEAFLQEQRLRARLPGVRHLFFRGLRPARNGIVFEVDARRDHEAVVGQLLAVGENDFFLVAINLHRPVCNDSDAVLLHRAVAVGDGRIVPHAAEIEIAVEAGLVLRIGLNQRDGNRAAAVLGDVFRRGDAARATADYHDTRLGLPEYRGRTEHHDARERCRS